jgi:hypothetical protein
VFIGVIGGPIRTRLLRRLRPIIHLPDLEIRILLPTNAMPPAIHIMRERPCADFTEAVELGDVFNSNDYITHFLTELTEFQIFTGRILGSFTRHP